MAFVVWLAVTVGLLALGFFVGSYRERHHLSNLDTREAAVSSILVIDVKTIPPGFAAAGGTLVMGEAVIAADYFKSFLASIRGIFGGELKTYQTLLSRARREAKVRMIEQARSLGAELVINVRFQWSDVGPRLPSAEIFCYGTAVIPVNV